MLRANKAREIAQNRKSEAAQRMQNHVEELIEQRAKDGMFWLPYDYGFNMEHEAVTREEVVEMVHNLQDVGYDVKNNWFAKNLTIRW